MGLLDLPAPVFGAIDQFLGLILPAIHRLVLWGILSGWLTMVLYRRASNQDRIRQLKVEQKKQQKNISGFEGEFEELLPVIRHTLGLGFRQLGLSLGPALLATLPILLIIVWLAGEFGYRQPEAGDAVQIETQPPPPVAATLEWSKPGLAENTEKGWTLTWPAAEQSISLLQDGRALFELPLDQSIPVIHKRQWWNWLVANPIGYLPPEAVIESVDIDLPQRRFLSFGPGWMRGWMFSFFTSFLLSSIAFKLALKID